MKSFSNIKHREFKIPLTKKGKYKLYFRFMIDTQKKKMVIRNAFLTTGKKEEQLEIDVAKIEEFNTVGSLMEMPRF